MSEMEDRAKKEYAAVARCIYCGSTEDLTDEHPIPFGLGGIAILPKSSCKDCAAITCKFEKNVMRGPMQQVRVYRGIKSRTKHREAPKTKPVDVTRKDGTKETIEFGFAEAPIVYGFPVFAVPALLDPTGYESGIRISYVANFAFGQTPESIVEQLELQTLTWTANHKYADFARMLAKIAYSSLLAQMTEQPSTSLVPDPDLLSAMLGKSDDIGRWVGSLTKSFERHENHLHRVVFGTLNDGETVCAEVQIFADCGSPHYGVILGKGRI
jgi:hypothetical protein